jgi:thiamine pyrophosphokinase
MQTIILADGEFPKNEKLLKLLREAERVICCDGSAQKLLAFGREPNAIVGDLDSLPANLKIRYADRVFHDKDQETNDLTKAVTFCTSHNYQDIGILGSTGLREDHTLGNLSLLADYALRTDSICLLTDYGRMDAMHFSRSFKSIPGQQVSIFSLASDTCITAHGLLYPIENRKFSSWWQGTLNQALEDSFSLDIDHGCLLVYRLYL